jgi:hypothetical protein
LRLRSGCEFVVAEIKPLLDGKEWRWPSRTEITADFTSAKTVCFPPAEDSRVTVTTWQDNVKPTATAIPEGMAVEASEFGDFDDRVAVKEHDFGSKGKGAKKTAPDKKLSLIVKGNWEGDDFEELDELVAHFPEQVDDEDGTSVANPKHAFVKKAAEAHRKALRAAKKAKEKKEGKIGDDQ